MKRVQCYELNFFIFEKKNISKKDFEMRQKRNWKIEKKTKC